MDILGFHCENHLQLLLMSVDVEYDLVANNVE